MPDISPLPPSDALEAFAGMVRDWQMPPGRAWRMLTGQSKALAVLTEDQAFRVAHLLAIDRGMREIGGKPVGEWLAQRNPAPLFGNTAPVDYLARRGMPGYLDLLRQVRRWTGV